MRLMTMRLLASADSVCSSLIVDGKQLGYNVRKRIMVLPPPKVMETRRKFSPCLGSSKQKKVSASLQAHKTKSPKKLQTHRQKANR